MQTFIAGDAVSLAVPLQRGGEPFLPDGGVFSWTIRGQDGTLLSEAGEVINVNETNAFILISDDSNQLSNGRQLEKRSVMIDCTINSVPYTFRVNYQLSVWLNFTVTCDDVRAFIGAGGGEVPDSDISLIGSFYDCAGFIGSTALTSALSAGDEQERQANRAIVAQAVLLLLPSLQARLSSSESDGNMQLQRSKLDFSDLEDRASDQLTRAINIISARLIITPTLVVFTAPTDPVTGS